MQNRNNDCRYLFSFLIANFQTLLLSIMTRVGLMADISFKIKAFIFQASASIFAQTWDPPWELSLSERNCHTQDYEQSLESANRYYLFCVHVKSQPPCLHWPVCSCLDWWGFCCNCTSDQLISFPSIIYFSLLTVIIFQINPQ